MNRDVTMKIIFLGSQGSGKSTQAKILATKTGLPFIEMGQLLRERAKASDSEALQIKKMLEVGNLIPNEITIKTLKARLAKDDCANGYILDGYPRNQTQLEALEDSIDKVFYIKITDEESIKRLTARGRHDDTYEVLKKRLEIYHHVTKPLIGFFRKNGLLEKIDGQRSIEEIAEDVSNRLENEVKG